MPLESASTRSITAPRQTAQNLLVIAADFPPRTLPTANRTANVLSVLKQDWNIQVVTATPGGRLKDIPVTFCRSLPNWLNWLSRIKLGKIAGWLVYPDDRIFWLIPAFFKALKLIRQQKPDVILVFMMPYSAGLIGVWLKWFTRIPLVLNLDDSPTCVDMHPSFPSRLHYQIARWLEDFYIRQANAVVYVSQLTLETVQSRQPVKEQSKLKLIRYGADLAEFVTVQSDAAIDNTFEIVYTGGMNGWYEFYQSPRAKSRFKRLYDRWMQFGRYVQAQVDFSSSSPMFIGAAIQQVLQQHPEWQGKVRLKIYGNRFSSEVVNRALANQNLQEIVSVFDPLPHGQVLQITRQADLLLITLPDRTAPSSGGRISAKTYEYLSSDRPILAAIPQGENWNYLEGKPGVWRVSPRDIEAMAIVLEELIQRKFAGQSLSYDRAALRQQLNYETLAQEFSQLLLLAAEDTGRSPT